MPADALTDPQIVLQELLDADCSRPITAAHAIPDADVWATLNVRISAGRLSTPLY
ncbi:hypothetical protein [Burkholderia ubonensis]|uniref:hypothetical protein n=1 Tax=Burkholderia ubonensis TaxID=101571 RepID=UPI000A75D121|nr:hypothetical protein [Burkholderia ubonensis]